MFVKLSDNPWGIKKRVSLCSIVFVKLSDNPWGTKQSHIVPSCLWSCLTTLEVLNSLTLPHRVCEALRQPWKYSTVSLCHIVLVKLSYIPWFTTKQSDFVTSCLWSCLKTLDVLKSHFVPSCLWSCLTNIEVINSLALSHHVCEVIWQPSRH